MRSLRYSGKLIGIVGIDNRLLLVHMMRLTTIERNQYSRKSM